MLPCLTEATVADGISAAMVLTLELHAITLARTGRADPMARIKEIRFRISATHLFDRFIAGRSHDNGLSLREHASDNQSFGLNRMVLLVLLEEELGKDGRGTKKEGVQTWAAGNAPWAVRYTGLMSESRCRGAVKAH
jgi:hypothetical protein